MNGEECIKKISLTEIMYYITTYYVLYFYLDLIYFNELYYFNMQFAMS